MNSEAQDLSERFDRMQRMLLNAVWEQGGCELVDEVERAVRTCPHCHYVAYEVFTECPSCGERS